MPQAAGIAAASPAARADSWAIRSSRKAIWSSSSSASSPWWSSNMPSSASTRSSCLAFIRVRARAASMRGSRSPAIIALIMSWAEIVVSLLATAGQLDQGAFQQLFQPLEAAGPLLGQPGPGPGVVPQVPDRLGRHERGPQQSHLGQPGQPHRVQFVRFGPAGQVPGLGRVDQLHRQPARLQHEETPVGRRRGTCGAGPFPATPGPNRTGTFQCIRLSSNVYVQAAAGFPPWMTWWQGAQTMSVLRRIFAIRAAQAGGCCPGEVRSASLRTWWVSTWPAGRTIRIRPSGAG